MKRSLMKRSLVAAVLLSVTGIANASLSWVETDTGTRTELFNVNGFTNAAVGTTLSLGYLEASVLGTATYTFLGEESGFLNNFKLTIFPNTQIHDNAAVGTSASSAAGPGALQFRFEGDAGKYAYNGGPWDTGTSIGLIGTNMTVFGQEYEYVIGYNDTGAPKLDDWDDMIIGVNFVAPDVQIPIPEPEIYAMMGLGLGLMGFMARRRRRSAAVA